MSRPVTLFTGQFADLPLAELAPLAKSWGYDGLELACWGDHFEVNTALADPSYAGGRRDLLAQHGLGCWAISNHLVGQAVADAARVFDRYSLWSSLPPSVTARIRAEVEETPKPGDAVFERTHSVIEIGDFGPVVACLLLPRLARQDQQWNAQVGTGRGGMPRHSFREGMGCIDHPLQDGRDRLERSLMSRRLEGRLQPKREQLRLKQNLIGVSVADAAEKSWIRQSPFQRVIRLDKLRREFVAICGKHVDPAGIEGRELILTPDHVQRSAFLRSRFGK